MLISIFPELSVPPTLLSNKAQRSVLHRVSLSYHARMYKMYNTLQITGLFHDPSNIIDEQYTPSYNYIADDLTSIWLNDIVFNLIFKLVER